MTLDTLKYGGRAPLAYPEALALDGRAPSAPRHDPGVPPGLHRSGRYALRFARSAADLRAAQRLRFEVFNLELGEGLAESYASGIDADEFDARCHHLLVLDQATEQVVGTYRLMTRELARGGPLYTASEFDLAQLPERVLADGAEIGRACVAKAHRNGRVLQLLWRGIARYLDWNDKRYVFGCCSIPTLEPAEAASVSLGLAREGHYHPRHRVAVQAAYRASHGDTVVAASEVRLPPLFASYLRLGAKVCGGPAFDRQFCVTDYFVLLDLRDVEPRTLASLAAPGRWQTEA